jgi:hypothetical protein
MILLWAIRGGTMSRIHPFISQITVLLFCLGGSLNLQGAPLKGKHFDRVITFVFENENYTSALDQPFFSHLATRGVNFSKFFAEAHPSQANYIALTSGSKNGVSGDDTVDLDVKNLVDLLEAKNISWKVYAEGYPGNCYTGTQLDNYVRKHNPFISYTNIQESPERCSKIVNSSQLSRDVKNAALPEYIFYVPDLQNDGHDTNVQFADNWYEKTFSKYFNDPTFMENTIVISTFDESGVGLKNQIYTSIFGPGVKAQTVDIKLDHYSILKLIEDNWNLGNLGKEDVDATPVPNIWL